MLGAEGEIVSWTIIRVPPGGFANVAPYPVVLVDLGGGKRMSAQLVDWSEHDLVVGKKVRVVVRRMSDPTSEGIIPYGMKVKPT